MKTQILKVFDRKKSIQVLSILILHPIGGGQEQGEVLVAVDMDLSAGHNIGFHRANISLVESSEKYPRHTLITDRSCSLNLVLEQASYGHAQVFLF